MNIFEALRQSHVIQRNLAERATPNLRGYAERRELFERLKNRIICPCCGRRSLFLYSFNDD